MIGSHWEARLFMTATMAAFTTPNPKLLPMTLALFEDSGWYKANYSMANRLQVGVDWGFQQGCAFALDYCVAPKANPVSTPSIGPRKRIAKPRPTTACHRTTSISPTPAWLAGLSKPTTAPTG